MNNLTHTVNLKECIFLTKDIREFPQVLRVYFCQRTAVGAYREWDVSTSYQVTARFDVILLVRM